MAQAVFGDLVVVIPGILGSRLARRQGADLVPVWDCSIRTLPERLQALAQEGAPLAGDGSGPPDDGVDAVGLADDQWLPGFIATDGCAALLRSLAATLRPSQVLPFAYDWRGSNRHAAGRLERFALDGLARWRTESGNGQARLWLVCHSTGGLVARYFCEALGGAEHTRTVVSIGTPHRGSVCALDALANGLRYGAADVTPLVRSLPSAYEMLPIFPVLREGSPDAPAMTRLAQIHALDPISGEDAPGSVGHAAHGAGAPLPGLERHRLAQALRFHAAIRGPAEARTARGEAPPYRQEVFLNRGQPTPVSALRQGDRVLLRKTYPEHRNGRWVEDEARGDGSVPAFAALPIEWESTAQAILVGERHPSMQNAPAVLAALSRRMHPAAAMPVSGALDDASLVALDFPCVLAAGQTLKVVASAARPTHGFVEVMHVATGARASKPVLLAGRDLPWTTDFANLRPGVHRVSMLPGDRRLPVVADYVFVLQ